MVNILVEASRELKRPLPELQARFDALEAEWGGLRCGVRVRTPGYDGRVTTCEAYWFVRVDGHEHGDLSRLTSEDLIWLAEKASLFEAWCAGVVKVLPPSDEVAP